MRSQNYRLAVTLGDPAGIGPEVILKALAVGPAERAKSSDLLAEQPEIVVVGDRQVLHWTYEKLHPRCGEQLANPRDLTIWDCQTSFAPGFTGGTSASGAASFTYLKTAITQTLAGEFDGIVTGPIAKFAWKAAGHHYPGQTEVLAEAAASDRFGMLFAARSPLTQWQAIVLLATTHIPLNQVSSALSANLIAEKLELLADTLAQDFGITDPNIAVAGLNPHSGEGGQLGNEEVDWLSDVIAKHPGARGPIPPDTMWVNPGRAWYETGTSRDDAYLALYHDQGLIPLKLMAFDRAVNVTIGLPFIRTSPDHGTAFDIAGQGIADATSMREAISLAAEISHRRRTVTTTAQAF